MANDDVQFDELDDLSFIKTSAEGDPNLDVEAAFLDLEEDDDELRTIYIQNEDDEIISPFSGTNDIYVTYRPGIYGCMETDKEFKVVVIEEIEED